VENLLGAAVVGSAVVGAAVVGSAVVGAAVVGSAVVGAAVVGSAVVGAAVVGTGVAVRKRYRMNSVARSGKWHIRQSSYVLTGNTVAKALVELQSMLITL
jgi:hypothetical protein